MGWPVYTEIRLEESANGADALVSGPAGVSRRKLPRVRGLEERWDFYLV